MQLRSLIQRSVVPCVLLALAASASSRSDQTTSQPSTTGVHYLEIVTPEVDATCATYERVHGVTFGDPEPGLGNARTADLGNGGKIGVRAPLRESEEPVVRAYLLVDDIEAAVRAAAETGAEIAHPPLELPGHGTFAIYFQGGVQHALWQR